MEKTVVLDWDRSVIYSCLWDGNMLLPPNTGKLIGHIKVGESTETFIKRFGSTYKIILEKFSEKVSLNVREDLAGPIRDTADKFISHVFSSS